MLPLRIQASKSWSSWLLCLSDELVDGWEVFEGVALVAHESEDLVSHGAERDRGLGVDGSSTGQAQILGLENTHTGRWILEHKEMKPTIRDERLCCTEPSDTCKTIFPLSPSHSVSMNVNRGTRFNEQVNMVQSKFQVVHLSVEAAHPHSAKQ